MACDGSITLTSTNDNASQTLTVADDRSARTPLRSAAPVRRPCHSGRRHRGTPVADPNSQAIRASLVSQYNNIIAQITTTSQDSSFNGINLLNGDDLKLTFNETGKSTLNITGVTYQRGRPRPCVR